MILGDLLFSLLCVLHVYSFYFILNFFDLRKKNFVRFKKQRYVTWTLLQAQMKNIGSIKRYFHTFPFQNCFVFHLIILFLRRSYDEIFLSRPWNFYVEIKVSKYSRKRNVSWNIIQFVHTIKFHSYDHNNVSFIERINNFHFSCYRYYSFKSCLKILKKHSQLCC